MVKEVSFEDGFVVKIIFSIEHAPAFIVVYSVSELSCLPFEQNDFRVQDSCCLLFTHTFGLCKEAKQAPDSYENLFSVPCSKYDKFITRDLTCDLFLLLFEEANAAMKSKDASVQYGNNHRVTQHALMHECRKHRTQYFVCR